MAESWEVGLVAVVTPMDAPAERPCISIHVWFKWTLLAAPTEFVFPETTGAPRTIIAPPQSRNTPPPASSAQLPERSPPDIANTPTKKAWPLKSPPVAHTPPPARAELPEILPPFIANEPQPWIITPPPNSVAALQEMTPPFIRNRPADTGFVIASCEHPAVDVAGDRAAVHRERAAAHGHAEVAPRDRARCRDAVGKRQVASIADGDDGSLAVACDVVAGKIEHDVPPDG